MRNQELLSKIYEEYEERFYELGQYCFSKETVELHYPIGTIILKYNDIIMKKQKWRSFIEEITMEEAICEFFDDGDWDPRSWEDTEQYIDSYIEEFSEISDKEEYLLRQEIKKEFDERVNEIRQEEINRLKDRKSILNWIEGTQYDFPDEGEVGYMLSKEEILDLILQNGNK